MSERFKVSVGLAVMMAALAMAIYSYRQSATRLPHFVEVQKPTSPQVEKYMGGLHTEVMPTEDTAPGLLDEFETTVREKVSRDYPAISKPDDLAHAVRELLETMWLGDYEHRNQAMRQRGMRTGSADPGGKDDFEAGVKQTTYLTPIGMEQMSVAVIMDRGKRMSPDEVEEFGFSRLTLEPSKGVFPEVASIEAGGATVVEVRIPMQLPSQDTDRKIIVSVGIRVAWNSEKQQWIFWSYVVLGRPGEAVIGPPF